MSLPLSGIRIVDIGLYVAGPYASVPLGDLGAEIIKIEPLGGDPNRTIWRAFGCCNRGKRVISLDLKSADGLELAQKICAKADVVHHNFRPGVMERIGLGYDSMSEQNPGLIFLETSAYGHTGPMAKQPGFDMILQALCGHEARGAGAGNDPMWMRWAPVDFTGGYLGAIGILAALYRRLKDGRGGVVRANLLDSGIYMLSELLRNPDRSFSGFEPLNANQTGSHPARCIYPVLDGWVAIVARSGEQAQALAQTLELDDLSDTPLSEWGTDAEERIGERLAALTTDLAVSRLRENGVWVEPCRQEFQETLFNDAAWQKTGIIKDHPHPRNGHIRQLGNMVRFSGLEPPVETGGMVAELGEHTREILAQFGYAESEIDDLYERKIVA